jgi:hypothetical protein
MGTVPTSETLCPKDLRPGRYRHFKGQEYEVLSIARHSETAEWYAVYCAVAEPDSVWVRPARMFTETVQGPNGSRKRFEPSEPKSEPLHLVVSKVRAVVSAMRSNRMVHADQRPLH